MNIGAYMFGPQLIGAIILLLGLIIQKFRPKKINKWYGYRTETSMRNQQTWDEANRYSARVMVVTGMILFVSGIAITLLLSYLIADTRTLEGLIVGITIVSGSVPAVILIVKTERHLDKTFNNKNEIR